MRTAIRFVACQPASSAAPKETVGAARRRPRPHSRRAASTMPAPCAAGAAPRIGTAVPTSTPFSAAASSDGRIWASTRRRAADECGRRARAADRPVPRRPVLVPARIGGHELDPAAASSGLIAAAEGEAVRGERRDPCTARVRAPAGGAERDGDVHAAGERRPGCRGCRGRHADDGHVDAVVQPEGAGGNAALDEDRRPCRRRRPRGTLSGRPSARASSAALPATTL